MPLTDITYLFTVQDIFFLTAIGLTIIPDREYRHVKMGARLLLIRPDRSQIEALAKGYSFSHPETLLLGLKLNKNDVPVGTEVWQIN